MTKGGPPYTEPPFLCDAYKKILFIRAAAENSRAFARSQSRTMILIGVHLPLLHALSDTLQAATAMRTSASALKTI